MATLLQFPIKRFQLLIRRCITLLNRREGERQIPKQRWGSDSDATRGVTACRQRRVFVSNCVCVQTFLGAAFALPLSLSYHANPCVSLSFVLSFTLAHSYCAPLVPHNFCLLVFSASFCSRSRCRCRRTTSACLICSISCVLHTHTHALLRIFGQNRPENGQTTENTIPIRVKAAATRRDATFQLREPRQMFCCPSTSAALQYENGQWQNHTKFV